MLLFEGSVRPSVTGVLLLVALLQCAAGEAEHVTPQRSGGGLLAGVRSLVATANLLKEAVVGDVEAYMEARAANGEWLSHAGTGTGRPTVPTATTGPSPTVERAVLATRNHNGTHGNATNTTDGGGGGEDLDCGIGVAVTEPLYFCDGELVSEEEYNERTGGGEEPGANGTSVNGTSVNGTSTNGTATNGTATNGTDTNSTGCEIVNFTFCVCPRDRVGLFSCDESRSYSCNTSLAEPALACKPYPRAEADEKAYLLDGDPECLTYEEGDVATLEFSVTCAFRTPDNNQNVTEFSETTNATYNNFSYWVDTDQFSLSMDPNLLFRVKVFNFHHLTDNNQAEFFEVQPALLNGSARVTYSLDLAQVDDKFFAGGRLYLEAAIMRDGNPAHYYGVTRQFVDVEGRRVLLEEKRFINTTVVTVALIITFLVMCTCSCVFYRTWYVKYRGKKVKDQ